MEVKRGLAFEKVFQGVDGVRQDWKGLKNGNETAVNTVSQK